MVTFETNNEEWLKQILGEELPSEAPLQPRGWKRELRGGRNLFTHPSDLEFILTELAVLKT